ncbi:hypothetical protein AMTRI_Chr03g48120 [Amborella trichopoda]
MVLIFFGRRAKQVDDECAVLLTTLGKAISILVSKGLVEDEKLDSFDLPCYTPCVEEGEEVVEGQGSFTIEHFEQLGLAPWVVDQNGRDVDVITRAVVEPMINHHFGEGFKNMVFEDYVRLFEWKYLKGGRSMFILF